VIGTRVFSGPGAVEEAAALIAASA
jgi:hypothetical protein